MTAEYSEAALRDRYPLVVGGREVSVGAMMAAKAPGTGETVAEVPLADAEAVDRAVGAASDAHPAWPRFRRPSGAGICASWPMLCGPRPSAWPGSTPWTAGTRWPPCATA